MKTLYQQVMRLVISLAVSVFFIFLFLDDSDWIEPFRQFDTSRVLLVLLAVLSLMLCFCLRMWRWHYILRQYNPQIRVDQCFTPYFSSFALNSILPFRLGDVSRAVLFTQHLGVAPHAVASSLLLERIFDFGSILVFFYLALFLLPINLHQDLVFSYIFYASIAVLAGVLALIFFSGAIQAIVTRLHAWSAKANWHLLQKICGFISVSAEKFYLHINPASCVYLFVISLMAWCIETFMYGLMAFSLGIHLSLIENFLVMSASTLSTLLPSTPGYVGTFHYLCKISLNFIGVDNDRAIAASVLMHAGHFVPSIAVGLTAFIWHFGKNWRNKFQETFQHQPPP